MSHPDAVSQWPPLLSMLHLPPETTLITQQMCETNLDASQLL